MTVPRPDFSGPYPSSLAPSSSREGEVVEALRSAAAPRSVQDLAQKLRCDHSTVRTAVQSLVKLRVAEEAPGGGSGKGPQRYRLRQPAAGQAAARGDAAPGQPGPAGTAPVAAGPTPSYVPPGLVGYYPYGQQMFYYTLPMAYQAGGAGGTKPGAAPGRGPEAGPAGVRPLMVPYAFPQAAPYGAPLRLPGAAPAAARRPVNHGWGGVPLGSQAVGPHTPLHLAHAAAGGAGHFRGLARSTGAARTVPLPPRKASSPDGGAGSSGPPPTSPAQADRPVRGALAGSTLSSGGSSDGESSAGRTASTNSIAGGADGLPAAADLVGASGELAQQPEQQGGEGVEPRVALDEHSQQQPGDAGGCEGDEQEASGRASPESGGSEQRSGSRGSSERQPCAFFLKTGTCAYGDRCKFEHPYELAPHVEFNSLGLPLRPAEPECSYYMKYRTCGFGHTCKFHHPELGPDLGATASPPHAFPVHYLQYPSGAFPLAYAYPGTPMQGGQMGPGFMPPHGAAFAPPLVPQPGAMPFVAGSPPGATLAPLQLPIGMPAGASAAAASATAAPPPPAAAAGPVPPTPTVAVPVPIPISSQQVQHAERGVASSPAAGSDVLPMSPPPRPLMVFGKKAAAE